MVKNNTNHIITCMIIGCILFTSCIYRHDGILYLSYQFHNNIDEFTKLENRFVPGENSNMHDIDRKSHFDQNTGVTVLQMSFHPISKKQKCNNIVIITGSNFSSGYLYYENKSILDTVEYYAERLHSVDESIEIKVKRLSDNWLCYNCSEEADVAILIRNRFDWND